MATRARLGARLVVALTATIVMVAAFAPSVRAEVLPAPPGAEAQANPPTSTVEFFNTGAGAAVDGFMSNIPPAQRLQGYPPGVAQSGWAAKHVGFAGLLRMRVISGPGVGTEFVAYCIDILTGTSTGNDYARGEWSEATIDNVGYVARLLQSYYPNTGEPASVANVNTRAAAVQSAIWFFSDGYVLRSDSPLYGTVQGIVNQIIAQGPLNAPPAPTVTITGPTFGETNELVGPFVVRTNDPLARGSVPAGVEAFGDADGTVPLGAAFPVADNDRIWLRSSQAGVKNPALTITASVTQPGGVVYVYVPPQSNPSKRAQTIIQAGPLTVTTDVNKTVNFLAPDTGTGQFTIDKTITGDAAGQQGPIRIDTVCSAPNSSIPAFEIPASATGDHSTVVTGITVPARCIVTENLHGKNQVVDVLHDPPTRAGGARRSAQFATQELSVCPAEQPLSASRGVELQAAPPVATFLNVVESTTTTVTSPITSTPTTVSTTTTTAATTTGATTTGATSTAATTTGATTTGATSTAATTTGATTTGATTTAATTTGATTTGATTTAAAVVPTTAVDECEFSGDTTSPTTTPETLPATGSSGSGPLVVGLIGLVAGLGLVAIASRRRFTD